MTKQLMRVVAISVFLVSVSIPVGATILQRLTLDEMAQKSTSIVRAKVTGSSEIVRGGEIFTIYEFDVLQTLKSGLRVREVAVPGGVAGGRRQVVAGAPTLSAGREYVLFLWTSRSGLTQLMGLSQGVFSVERTTSGDLLASRSAAGEQMLDPAGHAVRDEALSIPLKELKAPLKELKAKVSKAAVTPRATATLAPRASN